MGTTPLPSLPDEPEAPAERITVTADRSAQVQQRIVDAAVHDPLPPALAEATARYRAYLDGRTL